MSGLSEPGARPLVDAAQMSGAVLLRVLVQRRSSIVRWIIALALALLLASPLLPLIYQAFIDKPLYEPGAKGTLDNFTRLFGDDRFLDASINTLWFSIYGTLVSTVGGFLGALLLERAQIPFRRTLKILFLAPIFISALILVAAWSMLYGPSGYLALLAKANFGIAIPNLNSLGGMGLIAGVSTAPISYLLFAGAIRNISPAYENAARAAGASPTRAVRDIILPLVRPATLYCVLLNFVLMIDQLAIPLVIGQPARIQVLATYLYDNGRFARADYGLVSATTIVIMAIVIAFLLMEKLVIGETRRYATVGGRSMTQVSINFRPLTAWLLSGAILLYVALTTLVPGAFLVLRSFCSFLSPLVPISTVLTLENYRVVLGTDVYLTSISNTVIVSIVGGVIATALTFMAGIIALRSSPALKWTVEHAAFLPRAIPGIVIGIGVYYATIVLPGGGLLYGTLAVLVIAFTIRHFPTGFAVATTPILQVDRDLERAARIAGSGELRAIFGVLLPLLRPALIACFLLYFLSFFKEYAAASFLYGPDTAVLGMTLLELETNGSFGEVSVLAVVTLVLTVPIAIFVYAKD
jgi:iron(III) transport system permease protein